MGSDRWKEPEADRPPRRWNLWSPLKVELGSWFGCFLMWLGLGYLMEETAKSWNITLSGGWWLLLFGTVNIFIVSYLSQCMAHYYRSSVE